MRKVQLAEKSPQQGRCRQNVILQLQVAEMQTRVGRQSGAQAIYSIYKEENIMSFGKNLQMLRKKNQLSQEGLAEMLGVSRQAVSKWELGDSFS